VIPLQLAILLFVALAGTAVVLARDPLRQAIVNGVYGLVLTILFVVFQAPDVALSMLVVGSIAYPLVLLAAIKKVRAEKDDDR
jgi:energy-converting hydrogenase B subunit D